MDVSKVAHILPTAPNLKATPKTPLATEILKNFLLARFILHSARESE